MHCDWNAIATKMVIAAMLCFFCGGCNIRQCWSVTSVAPRVVMDVSCVRTIISMNVMFRCMRNICWCWRVTCRVRCSMGPEMLCFLQTKCVSIAPRTDRLQMSCSDHSRITAKAFLNWLSFGWNKSRIDGSNNLEAKVSWHVQHLVMYELLRA